MKKSGVKTFRGKTPLKSAGAITDVPQIKVGHAANEAARTGCTVILCGKEGAVCGVDVRGAAPGTRETDLLEPGNLVERVHAVLLAGGSAFGLDAAAGVMRFLEERGIGFDTGVARVPIVPAAVIFDLAVGDARGRPDEQMGYEACSKAAKGRVKEGQVGAGTGAMVGKILGMNYASPGGIGTASMRLANGATVGVLVVVNAVGDILDPASGEIIAGARHPKKRGFLNTQRALEHGVTRDSFAGVSAISNTTLAVVATDAALTKAQARKVAAMAHDGLARAIKPAHTMFDGDTIFTLSTGSIQSDVTTIGAVGAELLTQAVMRAARISAGR